jgi:hypothetical protein
VLEGKGGARSGHISSPPLSLSPLVFYSSPQKTKSLSATLLAWLKYGEISKSKKKTASASSLLYGFFYELNMSGLYLTNA